MRAKRKDNSRFWAISVAFHALLIGLFFLTPVGQRIIKQERPVKAEIIRKDEELAKVIDQIRQLAVVRLKDQVGVLDSVSEQMETNLVHSAEQYSGFMAGQIAGVAERLKQNAGQTLALQDELLLAVRSFAENPSPDADTLNALFEPSRREIETGLEEFRRALLLIAPENEPLLQELDQAGESQYAAFGSITQAIHNRTEEINRGNRLEKENLKMADLEKETTDFAKQLEQLQKEYAGIQEEGNKATDARKEIENTIRDLKKQVAVAKKEKTDRQALEKELQRAERDLQKQKQELKRIDNQRQKARNTIGYLERKIKQLDTQRQRLADIIAQLEEYIPTDIADRKTAIVEAVRQQKEAAAQQKKAYANLLAVIDNKEPLSGTAQEEGQP